MKDHIYSFIFIRLLKVDCPDGSVYDVLHPSDCIISFYYSVDKSGLCHYDTCLLLFLTVCHSQFSCLFSKAISI